MQIGIGYDLHKLVKGRRLILGGVEIPYPQGLLAHSDGDVLVHSIIDALLGALGEGDIGQHFPDTDEQYKDIKSLILLGKVKEMLKKKGAEIGNIDATVLAERPKIAPYVKEMKENISRTLKIEKEKINIKAKTNEGLGFIGKGEGIAALAVVSLKVVEKWKRR
ncbi:MAG: 2-C-methyl-D-erythritol 2,4-cyclodiphosphate synthase [Armatimonadetes bacterium CG07_land_8_20_14_0_80_40_9]|nr:MAG: 2-C-methyl-D-erythritol 2,4-cyclodiphosphate synthase [Armatimonadetes bacterium CG07_land_8_20_14_0_80_40_9]